jgi:hypothetical protein
MSLLRKRYGGYDREDKPPLLQTLIKGDSIVVRIGAFILCALLYYVIVQATHKETPPEKPVKDSVIAAPKK